MPADEPGVRFRPRTETPKLCPSQLGHNPSLRAKGLTLTFTGASQELCSPHFQLHDQLAEW